MGILPGSATSTRLSKVSLNGKALCSNTTIMSMKYALVALALLAVVAALPTTDESHEDTKDLQTFSEDSGASTAKWGGRRRRWHLHHTHIPHLHVPHRHHVHIPHRHHIHIPHLHIPHRHHIHVPHKHNPHKHTPIDKVTGSYGGNGGGPVSGTCPAGQWITEWEVRTGDLVDQVRGKCSGESKLFVVGSQSGKQTKTIPIPAGYKCAAEINKSNWEMAGLPHATCGDRFETTVSGDKLTVKRIDAGGLDGHGWGMKLQFRCSNGPLLAICGNQGGKGEGGNLHGWKKLSTTNIGVRTGV